ncbi:hypothetical protein BpHYR1_027330 [Brachionus plicatilis]|uniref:Uncharacterized protein n=1 Tax=Brachionus plicatilis TaxID=10195 RepID=A0A3M7SYE1_BRAPC|nr:hypothetical protein BpHYR1_027330 [Brachionus plicatilis]
MDVLIQLLSKLSIMLSFVSPANTTRPPIPTGRPCAHFNVKFAPQGCLALLNKKLFFVKLIYRFIHNILYWELTTKQRLDTPTFAYENHNFSDIYFILLC